MAGIGSIGRFSIGGFVAGVLSAVASVGAGSYDSDKKRKRQKVYDLMHEYQLALDAAEESDKQVIAQVVKPYVIDKTYIIPPVSQVDFESLLDDDNIIKLLRDTFEAIKLKRRKRKAAILLLLNA